MGTILTEKISLEAVGRPVFKEGKTTLYLIEDLGKKIELDLPPRIFVVIEPHGKEIALSPMMAGMHLFYYCRRMTRNMVSAMHELILPLFDEKKEIRLFLIPNGGNGMPLNTPLSNLLYKYGRGPAPVMIQSVMKMQRIEDPTQPTGYRHTLLGYTDDGKNEISGDIYMPADFAGASGETGYGVGKIACEGGISQNRSVIKGSQPRKKLFFFFYGIGSAFCLVRLYKYLCNLGIEFIPVFSTAIYDVTPGGKNVLKHLRGPTDLTFGGRWAITTEEIYSDAVNVYGEAIARIDVAGDTGTRLMKPLLFYKEQLTVIILLEKEGNPVPLEKSSKWQPARLMLGHPVIKKNLDLIVAHINEKEALPPDKEKEIDGAIRETEKAMYGV